MNIFSTTIVFVNVDFSSPHFDLTEPSHKTTPCLKSIPHILQNRAWTFSYNYIQWIIFVRNIQTMNFSFKSNYMTLSMGESRAVYSGFTSSWRIIRHRFNCIGVKSVWLTLRNNLYNRFAIIIVLLCLYVFSILYHGTLTCHLLYTCTLILRYCMKTFCIVDVSCVSFKVL